MDKAFFSTSEVAKILGVSRISVFKKIKSGEIKAKKIGRNFIIERKDLAEILESVLREDKKKEIEQVVAKAIKEYGETFRLLGKE